MEKTKTTKFLGSFSLSKNGGGAGGTTNYNDLTNKPKVNGIVLSGNKTSADLGITTLTPFPSTWPTTGQFEDLLAAIREDTIAVKGASFLGEVTFDDLPANLGNAEIKIEILEGTTSATKVIHSVITSGNREPYRWEYTSWNSGNSNSGWISFQLPLTAGDGISIENNVISTTGGADVPEDVYTQSNLLGGKSIEIVEEPVEGGIDNHTMACWHFDENLNPTILNGDISKFNITSNSTVQTSQFKFPTGALYLSNPGAYFTSIISNVDFFSNDFTIDFWFRVTTDAGNTIFGLSNETSHDVRSFPFKLGYGASGYYGDIKLKINNTLLNGSILSTSTWYHIATIFKYIDKSISVFVDGKKYGDTITLDSLPSNANNISLYTPSRVGEYIDELRVSDIARPLNPDGKFPVPTKPYSLAVPTGNKVINNTGVTSINTKKGNVTLTANDINVTYTHEGTETTTSIKEFADTVDHAIENINSLIPVNAYTAENLIAGKNITIEEVLPEGGIDEHTVACWHFDGNQQDEVSGLDFYTSDGTYLTGQFGQSLTKNSANYTVSTTGLVADRITASGDYTVDFWLFYNQSTAEGFVNIGGDDYSGVKLGINSQTGKVSIKIQNTEKASATYTFALTTWYHLVLRKKGNIISVFVNGVNILEYDASANIGSFTGSGVQIHFFVTLIDELRISDIARPLNPDGKFPVPTKAYSVAESTGKVEINNAITKTSQLTNDSGFITSVNSKTGNVILTGADIQTTYTYNSEETTTTINAFADAVFHNIDNVTALIPTKAVTSDNVTKIVKLTQAEYNALETKDDSTFYAIVG